MNQNSPMTQSHFMAHSKHKIHENFHRKLHFSISFEPLLTLFLFSSLSSVAYFDSTNTDNDGHNEEQDTSDQTSCDGPSLHILRHGISTIIFDKIFFNMFHVYTCMDHLECKLWLSEHRHGTHRLWQFPYF